MSAVSLSLNQSRMPTAAVWLLTIAIISAGCSSDVDSTPSNDNASEGGTQARQDSCRTRLDAAIHRLAPDSLSAIARLDSSIGALNAWLVECGLDTLGELPASEANLAFLETTARRAVSAPRFTARDATYIRDSLIASQLSQSIVERSYRDEETLEVTRILRVFRWIGNNISLQTAEESTVSKSFLDTLMTGRGSVRSRIWLLGVMLRQLQTDVVILLPGDAEGDPRDGAEMLVAVCLDDRVLLFDAQAWLPIPTAEDDSIQINVPAGAEFLNTSETWKQPQIRIVAETPTLCPRMLVLQEQLPVESLAMLYEELAGGTSEIRPLIERIVSAAPGEFDARRIAWWGWPDQQATAAMAPSEDEQRRRDALMKPFEAPFESEQPELDKDFKEYLSQDGITQEQRESVWAHRMKMEYDRFAALQKSGDLGKLFGRPSSQLLLARLDQVKGNYDRRVIQQFQKIRNASLDDNLRFAVPKSIDRTGRMSIPIPEAIRTVNQQATGNALYWIAICQMDRSKPGTAISSFESYRRQDPDGAWFYPSLMNQALAELAQGRREAAIKSLIEANQESNPDYRRAAILLQRLQKAIAADTQTETTPADGSAADDAEVEPPPTEAKSGGV